MKEPDQLEVLQESVRRIKVPRPMVGMKAPVFNFAIFWIGICFHVCCCTVCKGDGTKEVRTRSGEFIYIYELLGFWLDPVHATSGAHT